MNKRVATTAVSAAVAAGMVFGLSACGSEASDGFKKNCKAAGGHIERKNDFESLGMAPMAFTVPKPPAPKPAAPAVKAPSVPKAPKPAAPKVEIPKTPKLPKNDAPKSNKTRTPSVTATPNSNGLAFGTSKSKKRKSKKADDNDFLCVKDGNVLFEEDE
ncbi:hypothetical protein FDI38_gp106 [Streptomyces phage Peebs]|uniref:Lipoprotein n=1 Tax=Streptomyces phage Peebs TaxID=2023994 RepID=A0A222Z001_9CAUD|nr:hypothetical protein FDI38_gp106 [Streptomyces phage Peebs]ASR77861.1 hypothetical protein SEA_PEEBS_196 [Streptomyces phage Peebs]